MYNEPRKSRGGYGCGQPSHQEPAEEEPTAIRRASATGLPYGDAARVRRLNGRLNLNLTIRPRGRPRKSTTTKRNK